ncbi:MAG: redoxin domain-containing protein [Woeseiaceae bacterium]
MRRILAIAALLAVIGASGFLARQFLTQRPPEAAGSRVPAGEPLDFALPDLDGRLRRLSDWQGRVRLVNFWATWCAPCRREIPLLKKTQAAYAEQRLQVIGVAIDFTEDVLAYAEDAQFNYPVLIGQEDAMAAAERSGIDFVGMPFTLIVGPDGRMIKAHLGEIVEEDIARIAGIARALESGGLDLAGARQALAGL